jgi:hypothetical protein
MCVPHHNQLILQKLIWHLPMIPLFSLPQIWSRYHWRIWKRVELHCVFIGICCFTKVVILHVEEAIHTPLINWSIESFCQYKVLWQRKLLPQRYIYTPCYEGLALMPYNVWFGRFVCFIYNA